MIGQSMVPERLRTGVMAYLVVQRKREIALRIALGARRREVIAGMIRQSLRLADAQAPQ